MRAPHAFGCAGDNDCSCACKKGKAPPLQGSPVDSLVDMAAGVLPLPSVVTGPAAEFVKRGIAAPAESEMAFARAAANWSALSIAVIHNPTADAKAKAEVKAAYAQWTPFAAAWMAGVKDTNALPALVAKSDALMQQYGSAPLREAAERVTAPPAPLITPSTGRILKVGGLIVGGALIVAGVASRVLK